MTQQPDFSKGLIPAILQDVQTKQVLMLGYMNEDAYNKTLAEGKVCFYSRSKDRLWTKGETSGHTQVVQNVLWKLVAVYVVMKQSKLILLTV